MKNPTVASISPVAGLWSLTSLVAILTLSLHAQSAGTGVITGQISKCRQLFISGNNITNEPDYFYQNGDPKLITSMRYYGAKWVAGIKGSF